MREFLGFWRHALVMLSHVRGAILVLAVALLCCAIIIGRVEGMPFGDALYLTVITATTIGYGDITPTTTPGRILSISAGVIGLIFFGIIVAVSNRALAETAKEASGEQEKKK